MATYSVNPDLAEAFQKKFPRMASRIVEDFIRTMVGSSTNKSSTIEELKTELDGLQSEEANIYAKRQARIAQIKELEDQIESEKQQKLHDITELENKFKLLCQDSKWYYKFDGRYRRANAKVKGISEFDFYKEEVENA